MKNPSKLFLVLTACFVLLGLGLAMFHHHSSGESSNDCGVCYFVQQVVFALALFWTVCIAAPAKAREYSLSLSSDFNSHCLSSSLRDRAPPVFSF